MLFETLTGFAPLYVLLALVVATWIARRLLDAIDGSDVDAPDNGKIAAIVVCVLIIMSSVIYLVWWFMRWQVAGNS